METAVRRGDKRQAVREGRQSFGSSVTVPNHLTICEHHIAEIAAKLFLHLPLAPIERLMVQVVVISERRIRSTEPSLERMPDPGVRP